MPPWIWYTILDSIKSQSWTFKVHFKTFNLMIIHVWDNLTRSVASRFGSFITWLIWALKRVKSANQFRKQTDCYWLYTVFVKLKTRLFLYTEISSPLESKNIQMQFFLHRLLCQKWWTIVLSKSSKSSFVRTIQFCSNFPSMRSKYLSNDVWDTLDFQCQHQQWWHKIIWKSILAVNLLLNPIPTVDYADIRGLKSIHTFLSKMFVPHASEMWTKLFGPNYTKVWTVW